MATCPICKSALPAFDNSGPADGFDCPQHGKFKVSGTALAIRMDATREKWEAALKRAKARESDEWAPIIHTT
ncbi:MAG: hypothetical protein WBF58_23435, partial [Xanthobacteraceae bacterium]